MKSIGSYLLFFLSMLMFSACSPALSTSPATPFITPTVIPSLLPTSQPSPTSYYLPIETAIVIIETAASNFSPVETYYEEIGLVWLECEVPQEYYHNWRFATGCFNIEWPAWQEEDSQRLGERFQRSPGELQDLRLVIGKDVYETKHQGSKYELLKNRTTIATANSIFTTFDPNQALLNANNKIVWELAGLNSNRNGIEAVIIYDGINLKDKHSLNNAYIPYVIKSKLIFTAEKGGKFYIMYDEQFLGPEFDEISVGYCCSFTGYSIYRAQDQYWFWGVRDGKYYVDAIFSR